jgi:hypothetical protein
MKHHSEWYDSNGNLKEDYLLEIDISKLSIILTPICKINETQNCINLINTLVHKDIFFKLVPQSKIEVKKVIKKFEREIKNIVYSI